MGLTKRGKQWYVEFPVIDDGKVFRMAPYGSRSGRGIKIKRWKVGPKDKAATVEASKRVELETTGIPSKPMQGEGPLTFKVLTDAYLNLDRVKQQASYENKRMWVEKRFLPTFGTTRTIASITPEDIEAYYQARRKEVSLATANRELACIKHIFSWACGTARKLPLARPYLERNPARSVWKEKEDNTRDEIIEAAQFEALQAHSPAYLRPINLLAYATGMRRAEILDLTWDKVDLKTGFIRLKGQDTKSGEGRIIPLALSPDLPSVFRDLQKTRALHEKRVFLRDGQPITCMKEVFKAACKAAGIVNFRFHDLRHTAITNMRRAGIDPLTIMQITGHKTMVCFTRYNSFREADLVAAAERSNTYLTLVHRQASEAVASAARKVAAS